MNARRKTVLLSAALLTLFFYGAMAYSCTLIQGYFHQVTKLSGIVVGADRGDVRGWFQWSRHSMPRPHETLRLLPYPWGHSEGIDISTHTLKTATTDADGKFDFGTIPQGHYSLLIDTGWEDWPTDEFDVEIVSSEEQTSSVMIDVSPIHPDCTGGHQLLSFAK